MVSLVNIIDEDLVKYDSIFKYAEFLYGWNDTDAKKIVDGNKESLLFCYHPMYMIFSYG